ncbi:hypothetical protein [Reichenbachiella versicolor]|uniref:hypothetical protein n=1 Tax=Reichenbachiella versicolor TaxID=1821036 RepID=UPI000D6E3D64|nr:hypothetical protein [Reichenbachiella versicolor]
MFTEYEIETLIGNEDLMTSTKSLKKKFLKQEAPYLELSDEDFFALMMMVPTVGVALANGSVSLFEEMALNKKARKLSKGGYFLKKDPVVFGMKFLIQKYDFWEKEFLDFIRMTMEKTFDIKKLEKDYDPNATVDVSQYRLEMLKAPYIFTRFLASFFLESDDDVFGPRKVNSTDFGRITSIGQKLGLDKIPLFHYFLNTFEVK